MPKGEIQRYRGAPPAGGNADIVQIQTGAAIDETNQQIAETNTFAQQLSATLTQAQSDIDAAVTQADADRAASANGSASNYAANGSFEYVNADGSLVGWTRESSTNPVVDTTRHHSGTQSLRTTSGSSSGVHGAGVPVSQGQVWQMDRWFTADDTAAHNGGLRLQCSSDGGTTWVAAASSSTQATVANVWQYQAVRYTVAEGVTHIRPRIAYSFTESAHVWDDDVSLTNVTALVAAQAAADAAAGAASDAQTAADDAAAQAQAAMTAANGINKLFWGTAAPTSSTPGLPGDTWWVRADESSPITGQYMCTAGTRTNSGNVWEAAPLSHETIASVDAGTIDVGTLNADRIGAESITGDKIAADTIEAEHMVATLDFTAKQVNAGTFVGGFWKTDTTGRRMEVGHNAGGGIDPSNIAFYNGVSGETSGIIGPWNVGGGTSGNPALAVVSPRQSNYPYISEIDLIAGTTATTTKKAAGAAAWGTEPSVSISNGNIKVYGDIQTTGRIRQGDDTAAAGSVSVNTSWVNPTPGFTPPAYHRIGDMVFLEGTVTPTGSWSGGSSVWVISGLPAPYNHSARVYTYTNPATGRVIRLDLNVVSGIWCIVMPIGSVTASDYIDLGFINYKAG